MADEDDIIIKVENRSPVLCLERYEDGDDVIFQSRSNSPQSRVNRDSTTRSGQLEGRTPKKRTKKNDFCLDISEEEAMLEFLEDNPIIWNYKLTDYRRTEKKSKIWKDQATLMGKTTAHLQGWFKSLRDTHTRLHKKKSGEGAPILTEREQWIKKGFGFLKSVMRHRNDPYSSVKVTLAGDVGADEDEVDYLDDFEDEDSTSCPLNTSSSVTRSKRKRTQGGDEQTSVNSLQNRVHDYPVFDDSLQNKVHESPVFVDPLQSRDHGAPAFVDLFPNTAFEPTSLNRIYQQHIAERGVFANYVRDSLITMSEAKYKKARSAINKILTAAMEEDG